MTRAEFNAAVRARMQLAGPGLAQQQAETVVRRQLLRDKINELVEAKMKKDPTLRRDGAFEQVRKDFETSGQNPEIEEPEDQLAKANARIAQLEAQLAANSSSSTEPDKDGGKKTKTTPKA
jgi:hypothetical protein